MRALEVVLKTGKKSIFRTLPYILHVRPLLAQKIMHHANDVPPDFSNVLLNLCQNCKMHFVEDVTGWWTAKTVRKFMQMRAQENFRKTSPKVYSFVCSLSKTYHNQAARSAGSHISQFFDLLQFLGHQKIFYKTCMCAVKVALNFLPIPIGNFSYLTVFQDSGLGGTDIVPDSQWTENILIFHAYAR